MLQTTHPDRAGIHIALRWYKCCHGFNLIRLYYPTNRSEYATIRGSWLYFHNLSPTFELQNWHITFYAWCRIGRSARRYHSSRRFFTQTSPKNKPRRATIHLPTTTFTSHFKLHDSILLYCVECDNNHLLSALLANHSHRSTTHSYPHYDLNTICHSLKREHLSVSYNIVSFNRHKKDFLP